MRPLKIHPGEHPPRPPPSPLLLLILGKTLAQQPGSENFSPRVMNIIHAIEKAGETKTTKSLKQIVRDRNILNSIFFFIKGLN